MCINIMEDGMDTRTTHVISDYLRKTRKPGPKLNFKLRVSLKQCGAAAVKTAVRKYLPREQRRARLAELDELCWKDGDKGDGRRSAGCEESPAAACARRHPAGSMAPENTTQYLMTQVYEDMTSEGAQSAVLDGSRSPRSATADPDVEFESCLAFQQKDFEDAFGFDW